MVHISLSDPRGLHAKAYDQNVALRDNHLAISLYLGANAAPGGWIATLRDVLTGQQTNVKLDVTKN